MYSQQYYNKKLYFLHYSIQILVNIYLKTAGTEVLDFLTYLLVLRVPIKSKQTIVCM